MNGKEGVRKITNEMITLLEKIDSSAYKQPIDLFDGSSLGKHFRHIFDFYRCLAMGLDEKTIDYSTRQRDPQIEIEPQKAAERFRSILDTLEHCVTEERVAVLSDFSTDDQETREAYESTIGRELAFIHDHAVHHLAIIKMGIKVIDPQLVLEENFGLAPSTVKFQQGN